MSYKKYCNDILHCVYCRKCVNLYYAKCHLKTKKCKSLQEMIPKEEYSSLYLKFIRDINKLRSELKFRDEDPDSDKTIPEQKT